MEYTCDNCHITSPFESALVKHDNELDEAKKGKQLKLSEYLAKTDIANTALKLAFDRKEDRKVLEYLTREAEVAESHERGYMGWIEADVSTTAPSDYIQCPVCGIRRYFRITKEETK